MTAATFAAIPPSVANANAQLASADAPAGSAKAMSAAAPTRFCWPPPTSRPTPAGRDTQVVAADQLNDVDRALQREPADCAGHGLGRRRQARRRRRAATASSNESSTWDQTSLIGKIFIGFGALLTMASAARMFMA